MFYKVTYQDVQFLLTFKTLCQYENHYIQSLSKEFPILWNVIFSHEYYTNCIKKLNDLNGIYLLKVYIFNYHLSNHSYFFDFRFLKFGHGNFKPLFTAP